MPVSELKVLAPSWVQGSERLTQGTRSLVIGRDGAPRSHCFEDEDGLVRVALFGELPADWSVRLTQGAAARGISLIDGYARRDAGSRWIAHLRLDLGFAAGSNPDFVALSTCPLAPASLTLPRVLDFEVSDSEAHGGSLLLEIHAWDDVGLLAAVLGRAADVGLYAEELVLDTEDGIAFQHLALQPARGVRPSEAHGRRLRRAIDRLRIGS